MKKIAKIFPVCFSICIIILCYVKKIMILKIYPPCCNLFYFLLFFVSLFTKETVVQKIAKVLEGELSDEMMIYTRKLTYIWCIFTFFNFLISVATIFLSDKIWVLYNGCISYIIMGIIFVSEFIYRKKIAKIS